VRGLRRPARAGRIRGLEPASGVAGQAPGLRKRERERGISSAFSAFSAVNRPVSGLLAGLLRGRAGLRGRGRVGCLWGGGGGGAGAGAPWGGWPWGWGWTGAAGRGGVGGGGGG